MNKNEKNTTNQNLLNQINEAKQIMQDFIGDVSPVCGVVLGSGLNFYADTLTDKKIIPFDHIPYMPTPSAQGHKGNFVLGYINKLPVLCMQGRFHGYEGFSAQQVAFPVWLMNSLGVKKLITTNAVGAINLDYSVGSFCCMKDHINFTGRNPLVGFYPNMIANRFVSMYEAYDKKFRELLIKIAKDLHIEMHEGIYLGLLGPSFETPQEIKVFRQWGADTVAMSVVEEVIAARHCNMKVLGLSLVSNKACGIESSNPNSNEVMDVAHIIEHDFSKLLNSFIPLI